MFFLEFGNDPLAASKAMPDALASTPYDLAEDEKPNSFARLLSGAIASFAAYVGSLFLPGESVQADAELSTPKPDGDAGHPNTAPVAPADDRPLSELLKAWTEGAPFSPFAFEDMLRKDIGSPQLGWLDAGLRVRFDGSSAHRGIRGHNDNLHDGPAHFPPLRAPGQRFPAAHLQSIDGSHGSGGGNAPEAGHGTQGPSGSDPQGSDSQGSDPDPTTDPGSTSHDPSSPGDPSAPHPDQPGTDGKRNNRAPEVAGSVFLGLFLLDQANSIADAALLKGATDADGDTLAVTNLHVSSGELHHDTDGSWLYTPDDAAAAGTEATFSFDITDGEFSVHQTATALIGEAPATPIYGTDHDDIIVGTPNRDVIFARGGDDIVNGRASNDTIDGGSGNDRLLGGAGDDIIHGRAGNDVIFGEAGNDQLFGDAGNDTISGGEGADIVEGGSGDDVLTGGDGNDLIAGGEGADLALGGNGNDVVSGDGGNDRLSGGQGDDIVDGGAGDDVILVAGKADAIDAPADPQPPAATPAADGNDVYTGGDGTDTLDMSALSTDVTVDCAAGTVVCAQGGADRIASIEHIVTGSGDDTFHLGGGNFVLAGGDGDDSFRFDLAPAEPTEAHLEDFHVGDRLVFDTTEVREADEAGDDAAFDDIYFPDANDALALGDRLHIQVTKSDDASGKHMVLRAFEDDGAAEHDIATVTFDGHHTFHIEQHGPAGSVA